MPLQCLVFDCDGVILDSVPIKTRAFARLAEPYGKQARDRFVMYHTVHGGVSRYKNFEWFFREVLNREITPEESDELARLFAEYALDEVRRCDLIAGARDVLEVWRGKLPLYVCSGAPQEEVRAVLRERRIQDYFEGIYGSPPAKTQLLANIVTATGLLPETVLMVGDALTDQDAAEYAGTKFYGVGEQLKGGNYPWGPDLTSLNDWILQNTKNSTYRNE
jgi:phosphoglycolate phosphatase-like HAD superfamily hydrolase